GAEARWLTDAVFYATSTDPKGNPYKDDYDGPQNPIRKQLHTITSMASADVVCVLPKSRTSPVGNTLRSLSRNLSLLPPQGVVRTVWYPPRSISAPVSEQKTMNLLLVPFPFHISAQSFVGTPIRTGDRRIGWFHLNQLWLGERSPKGLKEFTDYIEEM